jgi:hypothetical protein
MKNQYNDMFVKNKQKKRLSGQSMFNSQLQTSMRQGSVIEDEEEEEDKVAQDMSYDQDQKLL